MMTKHEHIEWCKKRARPYLEAKDVSQAVASMLSDLGKHPETQGMVDSMGMIGIFSAQKIEDARRFVEGFVSSP